MTFVILYIFEMRILIILAFLIVCASCNRRASMGPVYQEMEVISIDDALENDFSFLDSMEVIPLEFNEDVPMREYNKFQYVKELDCFLIRDLQQFVFLYDSEGRFVSCSKECRGNGPEDYLTAVDVRYNPYSQSIDIYDPVGSGIIRSYDLHFKWLENKKLPEMDGFLAMCFDVLSQDQYLFEPVRDGEDNLRIKKCDFSPDSRLPEEDIALPEEGYVATLTMMQRALTKCDSVFYYTPYYLDYHFYAYDDRQKGFKAVYELDLGDKITKEDLDDILGDKPGPGQRLSDYLWGKCEYLLSSRYLLPIIRLVDDSYVYACCIRNRKTYHVLHDRESGSTYYLTPQASVKLHRCYDLQGKVLFTILSPYELEKYLTEETRRYFTHASLQRIAALKEDDNPVVIKYYLK